MTKQYGFDTETPEGNIKVVATNEETLEVTDFTSILDFLTKNKYRGSIFWLFNLRFDVNHILKATHDRDFLSDIYYNGVRRPGIEYEGATFQYIPGKLFKVCRAGHCVTFYDIAQFYNHSSLEKASQKYLNVGKLPDVDAKRLGEEKGYYDKHRVDTLAYCKRDAELTLKLAHIIEDTFTSNGISFRSPISQAKISEMYVRDNYQYPKVPDGLKEAHGWSYKAYHGGLFWTLQRGYFKQDIFSFDINSAYPAVMSTLPHWGNGLFKWVETPSEDLAVYGWYACRFNCEWIPKDDFKEGYEIDICFREKELKLKINPKRKIYPTGEREQVVTKAEYDFMKKHNYPCKFLTGLEWHKTKDKYSSPFEWMPKMYLKRIALKKGDSTGMLQYALKILLNGLYGKTAQAKRGMGKLTNFFYASYITAVTRVQVAEVALKWRKWVIEIATDSVTLTKDISAEIPINKDLGGWGVDTYKEGIFIGSGMRQEWYKDPAEGFVTYARGLTDKRDYNLLGDLERNREKDKLWFTRKRPINLGEMIVHYKALKYEDLGVFTSVRKRLSVNTDKKQEWKREYDNFGDFLDSEVMGGVPLEV